MSAVVVLEAGIQQRLVDGGIGYTWRTLTRLAERADPNGVVTVPLEWTMAGTGLKKRQQLNHLRLLEERGWLLRIDGGFPGRVLTIVIKRFIRDKSAFAGVRERARRAIYLARRARAEAAMRRVQLARRGAEQLIFTEETDRTLSTPYGVGTGPRPSPFPEKHAFQPDEGMPTWCAHCGLPKANKTVHPN